MSEYSRFFRPHRSPVLNGQDIISIEDAAPRLLHDEIKMNLLDGTPLSSNNKNGRPFLYQYPLIPAVVGFCYGKPDRFTEAQRSNMVNYLLTFGFPTSVSEVHSFDRSSHPLWSFGFEHPNFVDASELKKSQEERPVVFLHGRFNGFPHPGIVSLLIHLRCQYPHHEIWTGIEDDVFMQDRKEQPFVDHHFRATLLAATGLVDRIILTHTPNPVYGSKDNNDYWKKIYTDINPSMVVVSKSVPLPLPELDGRTWMQAETNDLGFYLGRGGVHHLGDIHQAVLKDARLNYHDVSQAWEQIRTILERESLQR